MYKKRIDLTPTQLRKRLRAQGLHPSSVAQIENTVAVAKESKRIERISSTVRKRAWLDLLQPLRYELNSARVGRSYSSNAVNTRDWDNFQTRPPQGATQRLQAFDAYIAVMEKLLARFELPSMRSDTTPAQVAKEKNERGNGSPITNNGEHWTDWVPTHIKNAVAQAFSCIPHKAKAKRKVPFPRTTLAAIHNKRKEVLIKRTASELANAQRLYEIALKGDTINTAEDKARTIERITNALKIIEDLGPNELVPTTWQRVEKL